MIILSSTSDTLQVITSAAITVDVHASWVDKNVDVISPGRTNTAITTAATTAVVGSPAASVQRNVKGLFIRNRHATTAVDVTVRHFDGTTTVELIKVALLSNEILHYLDGSGWIIRDSSGRAKENSSQNGSGAAVNTMNLVVLTGDVTNANATANTIADVTGLSFSVTAGETYWFRASIPYTAAATTTGSRWSVNGPASPTLLIYKSECSTTATTNTVNEGLTAYDLPAASNASSAAVGGNTAIVEGVIRPSANGTVTIRFASEILSSAIIAKAGSLLQWVRVL